MADLTIRVPPEHVDLLADELLRRYARLLGELHAAASRHAGARDALPELLGLRVELLDLDDALEQLGWGGSPPGAPLELTAHPEVLADAVTGALAAAAARVARERAEPGSASRPEASLRGLAGLLELTGRVLGTQE
jgi:hypothetical protein